MPTARFKPWNKRKRFCRKSGGPKFHFSARGAGWGWSKEPEETVAQALARIFLPIFRPAPNNLMKQRLNRIMPPPNKVEREVLDVKA